MALTLKYVGARPYCELNIGGLTYGFARGMERDDVPEDFINTVIKPALDNGGTMWTIGGGDDTSAQQTQAMLDVVQEPEVVPEPAPVIEVAPEPEVVPEPAPEPAPPVVVPEPEPVAVSKPEPEPIVMPVKRRTEKPKVKRAPTKPKTRRSKSKEK